MEDAPAAAVEAVVAVEEAAAAAVEDAPAADTSPKPHPVR